MTDRVARASVRMFRRNYTVEAPVSWATTARHVTPTVWWCATAATMRFIRQFGPGRPQQFVLRLYNNFLPSTMFSHMLLLLLSTSTVFRIAESCSSRSTPKPRPTSPTMRPNITFQTYACPETYAKWYCLNGATCFAVKIRDSILYNCECSDGYMGQRCEFKDLDGSYLPSRERVMIETAGIAGGVTLAVMFVVLISLTFYVHVRRRCQPERMYHLYSQHLMRKTSGSYRYISENLTTAPCLLRHQNYPPIPPHFKVKPYSWRKSEPVLKSDPLAGENASHICSANWP